MDVEHLGLLLHPYLQGDEIEVGSLVPKGDGAQGLSDGNGDLELLLELSLQTKGQILILATLSAGKLPPEG